MTTGVGHRLAAASLVIGVSDVETEAFKKLESCDADLDMKGVNVAGNEQSDAHGPLRMSWLIGCAAPGGKDPPGPCPIRRALPKVNHRSGRMATVRSPASGRAPTRALWRHRE